MKNRFFYICPRVKRVITSLLLSLIIPISLIQTSQAKESVPTGQLGDNVTPTHYNLELTLNPENESFSGKTTIDIHINRKTSSFYLHAQDIEIAQVTIESGKKTIQAKALNTDVTGVIQIKPVAQLKKGDYQVRFEYQAPFNENLQGLHRVKDGGQYYAFTQMESIYARYAFPSFDEPRFKTQYDLTLIVPDKLTAIANTPEISTESLAQGWKKITFQTSKPMPTYLFALAVGEFDVVEWQALPATSVRNTPLPLRGIATKGKGDKLKYALENTQSIVEALEDYFQIAYPYRKLDILAVPDFAAGAMENPGAITYREQILLLDENSSIDQKRRYKSIHAHELAHQWFGNLVTPIWWNDIWLNEAFATWMAATALHRKWPDEQWRRSQLSAAKNAMNSDSIPSARKVRNPILSNSDIITAFDGITYSKGGGVLSMIENFMGEEMFRQGVQKYMHQYAWKNADAIDFFKSIASVLKPTQAKKVVRSFRNFVEQAGVPLIDITQTCKDERTQLQIQQQRFAPLGTEFKEKNLWDIPACLKYQVDGEVKQQCQVISKKKQTIELQISGCADWVMPNAKAAGYYRYNLNLDGWQNLLSNLTKLTPEEASSVLDSIQAAYSSGKLSTSERLDIIPATLNSTSWEVVTSGISPLTKLIEYADESQKNILRQMAGDIYRAKADALGLKNNTPMDKSQPIDTTKLRTELVSFMGFTVKDPKYREQLKKLGAKYIGFKGDNKIHSDAVISSLATYSLMAGVQEYGQPFVDALLKHLEQTNDGTLRSKIIYALSSTQDPKIGKQIIPLGISDDIRDNEKSTILFGLLGEEELDSVMWPWLQKNFDLVVSKLPTNYQGYIPYLFNNQCSVKMEERLDNFLKPRLEKLTGADRNFVKMKDHLQQCLVQKTHLKPQIDALVKTLAH